MRYSTNQRVGIGGAIAGLVLAGAAFVADLDADEKNVVGKPYKDIVGVVTVCRGYTGPKPIIWNKVYTAEECNELNLEAITSKQAALLRLIKVPVSQEEFDAYSSLAYNIGIGAFSNSTLLKALNSGDYERACKQILVWNKARVNGILQPVRGLTLRRQREYNKCITPIDLPEIVASVEVAVITKVEDERVQIIPIEVQAPAKPLSWSNRIRCFFLAGC